MLAEAQLPALEELEIQRSMDSDQLCELLVHSLQQLPALRSLAVSSGTMSISGARALATGLRTVHLDELDVSGNQLPNDARSLLEPLCRRLSFDPQVPGPRPRRRGRAAADDEWFVRHRKKPEWGLGRVVQNLGDKLVIEFEQGGRRTIAAALPLLESVSLEELGRAGMTPGRPARPEKLSPEERALRALPGGRLMRVLQVALSDRCRDLERQDLIDAEQKLPVARGLRALCGDLNRLAGCRLDRKLTARQARALSRELGAPRLIGELQRRIEMRSSRSFPELRLLRNDRHAVAVLDQIAALLSGSSRTESDVDALLELLLQR